MSRSIFGWDLPPGVSTRDLPGNQDDPSEAFYDLIYDQFPETMDEALKEKLAAWTWDRVSKAWDDGYKQGMSDAHTAQAEAAKPRLGGIYDDE